MEPFDNKDKVPDFFASRAEKQADDMLDDFEKAKERLRFPMTDDEPVQDKKTDDADDMEVPYDFRADYQEHIGQDLADDADNAQKGFMWIKVQSIAIGIVIAVLVASLVGVFFFSGEDEDMDSAPIVVEESQRPVKVRPADRGGMAIPDQDKTIYKRMRTNKIDAQVEHLSVEDETPVVPQVPTKVGEILGKPRVMPETAEQMELEVLSLQSKAVVAPAVIEPEVDTEAPVKAVASVPAVKNAVTKAPAPVTQKASQSAKNVAQSAKATTPAATTKAKEASNAKATNAKELWRVQLISLPSKAGAEKAWPKILKAHSSLLSGLPHDVVAVQIKGKGTFYRLRVGAFAQKSNAQNLCNKLKARKQDCTLTK